MWELKYVRQVSNVDSKSKLVTIDKTYIIDNKNDLKDHIYHIMSIIEFDENKNPIEPTLDSVKRYNLYGNDPLKIDVVLKFFKKNYERYLDIILKSNDFENEDYKYDIVDQADWLYLDRTFTDYNKEVYKQSYFTVKKIKEEEKENGL